MKTSYIVTGAGGYLGGWIVRELLVRGDAVHALVLPGETCQVSGAKTEFFSIYEGDVCDRKSLNKLFKFEEQTEVIVIHCAALISISAKRDERIWAVNVEGTANMIDACLKNSVKKLVHISSVHAIPLLGCGQVMCETDHFNPDLIVGQYGKTKSTATQLVLDAAKSGLEVVVLHPSGLLGPGGLPQGPMTHLIKSYLNGRLPVAVHGGYDFVDVRDVAAGVISAAQRGRSGECYILSGRYIDLQELLDTLAEVSGGKRVKTYLPMWFLKFTAPLAELYYKILRERPLFTKYSLYTISENSLFTHDKASRELGYTTRDFKDTLRDTVEWLQRNKEGN